MHPLTGCYFSIIAGSSSIFLKSIWSKWSSWAAPDIVVKVTNREHISHVGGIWLFSVLNLTTAFCFIWLIKALPHPSMSKRGPGLPSYLDLVITLAGRFCHFCILNVWVRPSQTLQQYITATWLAELQDPRSAEWEVVSSNPSQSIN